MTHAPELLPFALWLAAFASWAATVHRPYMAITAFVLMCVVVTIGTMPMPPHREP